jgi:hypothetical protein
MDSLKKYSASKKSDDLFQCLSIGTIGALILYFLVPSRFIDFHRLIITLFFIGGFFSLLPKKTGSVMPLGLFLIVFSALFIGSNAEYKHKWISAREQIHTVREQIHTIAKHTAMPESEKQILSMTEQRNSLERRLKKEIPDFAKLLYRQAREIKESLAANPSPFTKSLLLEELDEIARTMLVLDKEEQDCEDLLSELSSNNRTLVRLKESEKFFGPEYDKSLEQSRNAVIRAKTKLNRKLDNELGRSIVLHEQEIHRKITELLN